MTEKLPARIAEIITRYSMLSRGDRVGVAVSGGADSVVLLHILKRLAADSGVNLIVLHMNHRLRDAESNADEAFVRELAQSLELPIVVSQSQMEAGNLERAARDARRTFFRTARQEHGLARIALGHTRGDQAETVLFRLLRGSGLTGLAAMRPVTEEGVMRPLLTTTRQEVRDWAIVEGLRWREDSSNQDLRFTRNRLRMETIPALAREFNPNLEAALAITATLVQAEEEYWAGEVERVHQEITERTRLGLTLSVARLSSLHVALQRRLIRHALEEVRPALRGLDFQHVEQVRALCESEQGHDRVIIPGADALRSFDSLLLAKPGRLAADQRNYSIEMTMGQATKLPFGLGQIYVGAVNDEPQFCDSFKEDREGREPVIQSVGLSANALSGRLPLRVRNWQPGDQLRRFGHESVEKIKTLFQEYRVRLWERRHWPVVTSGDSVVWVRDFGAAAQFGTGQTDEGEVRLVYRSGGSEMRRT